MKKNIKALLSKTGKFALLLSRFAKRQLCPAECVMAAIMAVLILVDMAIAKNGLENVRKNYPWDK